VTTDPTDEPAVPLNAGPPTTDDDDALIDSLSLLPPAREDRGIPGTDIARASARRTQAVRLRMAGLTYEQIANQVGYSDKSAARHAIMRALTRLEAESVAELRALENARLDADEMVLRALISNTGLKPDVRIKAVNSRLHLAARRSRLNGLDAPMQVAISGGAEARLNDVLNDATKIIMGMVDPDGAATITSLPDTPGDDEWAEG